MIFRFLIVLSLFFISQGLWAQSTLRYHVNQIESDQTVTAIAVRSDLENESVTLVLDQDTLEIPRDVDAPDFTYFLSLPTPYDSPSIHILNLADPTVFLINSGSPLPITANQRLAQDDCTFLFDAIPQSEWRAGLDAPSYNRSFTDVQHVVVHHSAGSNSNSNYTQVVRDIYEYHTQVNGWSDIGYNYLIAQNGNIYAGRDPASGNQDDVMGAHFCGRNSGTMGVCLLGNYETAAPTSTTWNSLQLLISYKLEKEELDPLEHYPHSLGSLGSVIGHSDGCSTLCPGEHVYNLLAELKSDIAESFDQCDKSNRSLDFIADTRSPRQFETVRFENLSYGYDDYLWELPGTDSTSVSWLNEGSCEYQDAGLHDVKIIGLINGQKVDSLVKENYIEVLEGVTIYPNPVSAFSEITINSSADVLNLFDASGNQYFLQKSEQETYTIPYLTSGIYFLQVNGQKFKLVLL